MSNPLPSIDKLKQAIAVAQQIEQLQVELNQILGGMGSPRRTTASAEVKIGKRTMSPAVRAKIAAAQRARWAKSKGETAAAAAKPKKKKGGMSAAGRAAIVAAQKARWAKIKGHKGATIASAPKAKVKAKRNISPEAKARMLEAVKRRWAKQKAAKVPTAKAKAKIAQAGQPSFMVL